MSSLLIVAIAFSVGPVPPSDTVRIEVGSAAVNARVYKPHRARVRVHADGPTGPVTNEWLNELTLGDSAGRPVMRWLTRSLIGPQKGNELRQTYDGITMAPLGWSTEATTGAYTRLRIDGNRITGVRRGPTDSTEQKVDRTIERRGFIASASDLIPATIGMRKGLVIIAPIWGPNMPTADMRIFSVIGQFPTPVEGKTWNAWKVEERREADRSLVATWYLLAESPYMVAGEMVRPDGGIQYASEIELPMEDAKKK